LVTIPLGGQATLRLADGGPNLNFVMLAPAVALNAVSSGGNLNLQFATEAGFNYTVLYQTNLSDATWTPLNTVAGDGTVKTMTDSMTAASGRFYLLEVH
jgi:hypothetical protein